MIFHAKVAISSDLVNLGFEVLMFYKTFSDMKPVAVPGNQNHFF